MVQLNGNLIYGGRVHMYMRIDRYILGLKQIVNLLSRYPDPNISTDSDISQTCIFSIVLLNIQPQLSNKVL